MGSPLRPGRGDPWKGAEGQPREHPKLEGPRAARAPKTLGALGRARGRLRILEMTVHF